MTGGLSGPRRLDEATNEADKANEAHETSDAAEGKAGEVRPGGLAGLAGIADGAAPVEAARRLAPRERLAGIVLRDGQALGTSLPALSEREIVGAWRAELGRAGLYVRCADRTRPVPTSYIQRLARVGELWLDGPLPPPDELLESLVAGVHRFVVWPGEVDDLDDVLAELGDAAALGWSGESPCSDAMRLALQHGIPVIATLEPEPSVDRHGVDVYRMDIPTAGRFEVRLLAHPVRPEPAAAAPPAPVVAAAADDAGQPVARGQDGADAIGP